MKKFLSVLFTFILVFSSVNCFATDVDSDSGDHLHTWYDDYSGDTEYLEDYSDYEDLINSMDEQEYYKSSYEQMITETVENYNNATREKLYKAKVLEATEPETYYGYYQYLYKSVYQVLKIEILDGINVSVTEDDSGTVYAYSSSIDSPVVRWGWIAALIVLALILVCIYVGKPGMKMLVPILLVVDLIIMVVVPLMFSGTNMMLLLGVVVLLSTITICVLNLGIRAKTFVAILATLIMTFVLVLAMYGFDNLAYMSGITYEITSFVESILPRVINSEVETAMDLHAMNIVMTALMAFFAFAPIVCKTIDVYDKKKNEEKSVLNTVEEMKEFVADKIATIVPILFTLVIPKYMILIINKCSLNEIINSEVLGSDIVRILFILITIAIAAPLTAGAGKLLIDDDDTSK